MKSKNVGSEIYVMSIYKLEEILNMAKVLTKKNESNFYFVYLTGYKNDKEDFHSQFSFNVFKSYLLLEIHIT